MSVYAYEVEAGGLRNSPQFASGLCADCGLPDVGHVVSVEYGDDVVVPATPAEPSRGEFTMQVTLDHPRP